MPGHSPGSLDVRQNAVVAARTWAIVPEHKSDALSCFQPVHLSWWVETLFFSPCHRIIVKLVLGTGTAGLHGTRRPISVVTKSDPFVPVPSNSPFQILFLASLSVLLNLYSVCVAVVAHSKILSWQTKTNLWNGERRIIVWGYAVAICVANWLRIASSKGTVSHGYDMFGYSTTPGVFTMWRTRCSACDCLHFGDWRNNYNVI